VLRAKSALNGDIDELIKSMQSEMKDLASRQEFERARELRDEISALKRLCERQSVERRQKIDQDVLSWHVEGGNVFLMLFKVYKGTLEGKEEFVFAHN